MRGLIPILGVVALFAYINPTSVKLMLDELAHIVENAPGDHTATAGPTRNLELASDAYGQFWIEGRANGQPYRFLIDTGAAFVSFSKADASRLGFNVASLNFNDLRLSTANGTIGATRVRLRELAIGSYVVTDFPAVIGDGEMGQPLIGMSLLKQMHAEMGDGSLRLHW